MEISNILGDTLILPQFDAHSLIGTIRSGSRGRLIRLERIRTAEGWAQPEPMDGRVNNPNSLRAICPLRASRWRARC